MYFIEFMDVVHFSAASFCFDFYCIRAVYWYRIISATTMYNLRQLSNWIRELSNSIKELSNWIRELSNLIRELSNWIGELSNFIIFLHRRRVGRIRELFNWIRERSNSITERSKRICALSYCTYIESSLIELENSLINIYKRAL